MTTRQLRTLVLLFLVTTIKTFGQSTNCDVVHKIAESKPTYDQGMHGLSSYFSKYLVPILKESITKGGELPTQLTIMLTINVDGKVTEATLSNHNLTKACQKTLIEQLQTMTGWTPGRINGQAVCCNFGWPISCIKWD